MLPENVIGIILGKLPAGQRVSDVVDKLLHACRVTVVTQDILVALAEEFGGSAKAGHWLIAKADELNRPILLHGPDPGHTSRQVIVLACPRSWSSERLRGYVGGLHEELSLLLGGEMEIYIGDGSS